MKTTEIAVGLNWDLDLNVRLNVGKSRTTILGGSGGRPTTSVIVKCQLEEVFFARGQRIV